jgi:hypothetical protein
MKTLFALSIIALSMITGCAGQHRPHKPSAPAPVVSTVSMGAAIAKSKATVGAATTHAGEVTRSVDKLILQVDPKTAMAQELSVVRGQLLTLTEDLKDATDAVIQSESAKVQLEGDVEKLRSGYVAVQQEAVANADGWQKASAELGIAKKTLIEDKRTIDRLADDNVKLHKDSVALAWWHRYVRNPLLLVGGIAGLWFIVIPGVRFAARFFV